MKKKLNKRGASAIEMVIGFMIVIMMLSFLLDIINVLSKYSVVAQVSTDIARMTGIQGGVLNSSPNGWPGGSQNYINMDKMNTAIAEKFASAGMQATDWEVKIYNSSNSINGKFGKNGNSPVQLDYLTNYTIEVRADYEWSAVSNFIPGSIKQTLVSRRPATSEWKYNYNNWIGEN